MSVSYVHQEMHQEAKTYFEKKHISQILESIVTGLIYTKPDDPLAFIEDCVQRIRKGDLLAGKSKILWDQFIPGPMKEANERRKEAHRKAPFGHNDYRGLKRLQPLAQVPNLPPMKGAFIMPDITSKPIEVAQPKDFGDTHQQLLGDSPAGQAVMIDHPNIFFVLGGPGSGKGTQCERLAKEFHLCHLSTGDLLRKELENGTAIGQKCGELMKDGKIVPMDIMIGLLKNAIMQNIDAPGFLLDGFPRAMDQALEFEATVAKCRSVLFFECPLKILESRLLERGKTSGRADDNLETIKKRFDTFQNQSLPVVSHFEGTNRVIRISATSGIDEVYATIAQSQLPSGSSGPRGKAWENIIFVLGGPGCGKGTQCVRIAKEFDYVHLSAGDLLRAEVASGSERAKELDTIMKEGKIVPTEVTLSLLKEAMEKAPEAKGFLIDGFPRQLDQAKAFEDTLHKCKFVLFFNCPETLLEARLLKRGETSGRADDNIETIKKRFNTFVNTSMPVIDYFKAQDRCVEISSEPSPDMVYECTKFYFQPEVGKPITSNIIFVLGGPGSGKGTQCVRLAREHGLTHLSTGDLLRAELTKGTPIGLMCGDLMKEGKIVPKEIMLGLLRSAIYSTPDSPGFLIDGFPRALSQARDFEKCIAHPLAVLFFFCPLDTLESRLLERGKTSGRADDNIETIKKRFHTFETESLPVVDYFESLGNLVKIDSTQSVNEVYLQVEKRLAEVGGIPSISRPFEGDKIVFVLGGPGSGKGTQCDRIVSDLQFSHLSTGDLLRDEVKKGTQLGQELEEIMREGKMVPLDVTLQLLTAAMEELKGKTSGFLIDGFPRTMDQAVEFERKIGKCTFVLFFDAPDDVLTARLLKRGETSGRADDNLESIQKRLTTFHEASLPVIRHFEKDGRVKRVAADGDIESITTSTLSCFQ
ncbi:adenylate kinase-domain-containing protein [Zopfochytrium polystomum]|nr:adenylate kinase-domain-containing protein [Zopfochytrium polystomum]